MTEQEERLTKKETYLIGLEEGRHNDHLKASNIVEFNKIITGVSIGLILLFKVSELIQQRFIQVN